MCWVYDSHRSDKALCKLKGYEAAAKLGLLLIHLAMPCCVKAFVHIQAFMQHQGWWGKLVQGSVE